MIKIDLELTGRRTVCIRDFNWTYFTFAIMPYARGMVSESGIDLEEYTYKPFKFEDDGTGGDYSRVAEDNTL